MRIVRQGLGIRSDALGGKSAGACAGVAQAAQRDARASTAPLLWQDYPASNTPSALTQGASLDAAH